LSSRPTDSGIRIGVIGVGHLGRHHARVAAQSSASLVGVFDKDRPRADQVSKEVASTSFGEVEELLERCDAIIVATPAVTHHSVASLVLEAGCHCLVEKPLATDPGSASDLVSLAERKNLVLAVGHSERFNPALVEVGGLVQEPLYLEGTRLSPFAGRGADVDVVKDMMVHDLEISLHWMKQYPSEVRAVGISVITDRVDMANVRLEFPSGAVANLTASRASPSPVRVLRIFERKGYISIDLGTKKIRIVRQAKIGMDIDERVAEGPEPLEAELQDFLAALRTGQAPRVTGAEGARALKLAQEIVEQIAERLERLSPAH